jgi:hypothetical protein
MRKLLGILLVAATGGALAQHAGHQQHQHQPGSSGYAGLQTRDIKALSPEQVAELRDGKGMGASLPAELNGVPGPLHVLQLAGQLAVTPDQRVALEHITADMKARAQALGAQVIAAEADLDRGFKSGAIDEKGIADATARIAALQGELRAVHLTAHLKTGRLLSPGQVLAYNRARGYAPADGPSHPH